MPRSLARPAAALVVSTVAALAFLRSKDVIATILRPPLISGAYNAILLVIAVSVALLIYRLGERTAAVRPATRPFRLLPERCVLGLGSAAAALLWINLFDPFLKSVVRFEYRRVMPLFDLSKEMNLATVFSTVLLLACAASLALVWKGSGQQERGARAWAGLTLIFGYLALDEFAQLHERLVQPGQDLVGGRLFGREWMLVYGLLLLPIGLAYLSFFRKLPGETRKIFTLGLAVYLAGVVGLEGLAGWLDADGALLRRLILAEETLEMAGALIFLLGVLQHAERHVGSLGLVLRQRCPRTVVERPNVRPLAAPALCALSGMLAAAAFLEWKDHVAQLLRQPFVSASYNVILLVVTAALATLVVRGLEIVRPSTSDREGRILCLTAGRIARPLVAVASALVFINWFDRFLKRQLDFEYREVMPLLRLTAEGNIPTLFATTLLLLCAAALALITRSLEAGERSRLPLGFLSVVFLFLALDESIEIHERLDKVGRMIFGPQAQSGEWVLVYGALLVPIILIYAPVVVRLPRATRRTWILAAAVYIFGALGLEFASHRFLLVRNFEMLNAAAVTEEAFELAGLLIFLFGALAHLERESGPLALVRVAAADATQQRE